MELVEFGVVEFGTGQRAKLASKWQRVVAKCLDLVLATVCGLVIAGLVDSPIDRWLQDQGFGAFPGWALIACSLALAVSVIGDLVGLVSGIGSIGKLALGLKVVSVDSGVELMVRHALLRAVVSMCVTIGIIAVCCVPFLWAVIVGWMVFLAFGSWMLWILSLCIQWCLLTKDTRQAIHDKIAKTIIVSSGRIPRGSWLMTIWR
ncbi:MAG: RDD family protein [Acidimicrobiaceae bacterium]|nr:RDD family protein [Acidimicrobiaceae bacterium]